MAERAGSGAVFRAQGLKVGAGPQGEPAIQRLDGSPASQADLGRLRAALRAEPAALQRRPDFFAVLTRGQFAELKRGYILRPELRRTAFQHIALTEDARDFRWSSSCSALSGDCNAGAQGMSYKKGQDVPPEVLKEVWDDVGGEQGDEDTDWGEYSEEDRRLAEAEDLATEKLAHGAGRLRSLGSILAGLGDWARGWGERAGFDGAGPVPASGGGQVRFADGPEGEARQTGAVPSAEAPRQRPGPPPAPQGRRAAGGRAMVYVLAAAGALIALGLRKKA
ncbi:MAG: hypothetical protein HYV15_00990 [Elusimicrobia bacterium]|nr:hypothetical protein [Elusimicrobiota bacterium]